MSELRLRNRQRFRAVDGRWLKRIATAILEELLGITSYELGLTLVSARQMARLNSRFLQHEGSTDVITFDYSTDTVGQASRLPATRTTRASPPADTAQSMALSRGAGRQPACPGLHGELFISVEDAVAHARQFRTSWPEELARYLIHGLLHLHGHDDREPEPRRRMKRDEARLLASVARRFPLSKLDRNPKLPR